MSYPLTQVKSAHPLHPFSPLLPPAKPPSRKTPALAHRTARCSSASRTRPLYPPGPFAPARGFVLDPTLRSRVAVDLVRSLSNLRTYYLGDRRRRERKKGTRKKARLRSRRWNSAGQTVPRGHSSASLRGCGCEGKICVMQRA